MQKEEQLTRRISLSDRIGQKHLDIARRSLLGLESLDKLATDLSHELGVPVSRTSLSRIIRQWIEEGRYELVLSSDGKFDLSGIKINEHLESQLRKKTNLFNASVVNVTRLDSALNEQYRSNPESEQAKLAYRQNDTLHELLGILGAKTLISLLRTFTGVRQRVTLGVTSGRGAGFTVGALADQFRKDDTLLKGLGDVYLQSLCGLGLIGPWGTISTGAMLAVLDADVNVSLLQGLFKTHDVKEQVKLCGHGVSVSTGTTEIACFENLDVVLAGMGCLNTRHNFLWSADKASAVHFSAIAKPLNLINDITRKYDELFTTIADIGHKFFLTCDEEDIKNTDRAKRNSQYRKELLSEFANLKQAVEEINKHVLRVPESRLRGALTLLVAGGNQKKKALRALALEQCKDSPIDINRTWLVTDEQTANYILGIG